MQGKYSEVVPDSYKGRTHTLWDQFQAVFHTPIKRCFSCGCDQCMQMLDADIHVGTRMMKTFTRIRFKAKISDNADEKIKKWARRMAMTSTKLVFKK